MKKRRIIPRLDIKGANLVKGIHLEGLRVLGLPERFSNEYFKDGADELIYIDSVASLYGRNNLSEIVRQTAENIFIPITVGGGIRSIADIRRLLRAGADKIAINTAAVKNPGLISEASRVFGSQCIVLSIQAMKLRPGQYEVYTDNAREPTGKDVFEWAIEAVGLGAGEVLITSIDREGTGEGYDLDLISGIVDRVNVPVIACGGAGKACHIEEIIKSCNIDAVCVASIFHYHTIQKLQVEKRKEGNIEYIKDVKNFESPVSKRLEPISVSELKKKLSDHKIACLNSTDNSNFLAIKDQIKNEIKTKLRGLRPRIALVDYGRSNLFSVVHAFESIGAFVEITSAPSIIENAERLVIAGVGAFHDGMEGILQKNLVDPIKNFAATGKPLLGICLGMQLFMTEGEEFGKHTGLDLIKGKTKMLKHHGLNHDAFKIPHIGWNRIDTPTVGENKKKWSSSDILKDIRPGDSVYFVHSYAVYPKNPNNIIAETTYGANRFCSMIMQGNIIGCQFHPERSGIVGLKIYRNFLLMK